MHEYICLPRCRDLVRQSSVVILVLCKCEEGNATLWSHTGGWLPKEWHQVIPTTFTYLSLARPWLCGVGRWISLVVVAEASKGNGVGHLALHLSPAGWAGWPDDWFSLILYVVIINVYTVNENEFKDKAQKALFSYLTYCMHSVRLESKGRWYFRIVFKKHIFLYIWEPKRDNELLT